MPQDNKIKIRRGLNSSLPAANTEVGELRYSTDTKELYIDDGTNNVKIGGNPLGFPVSTATQTALNLKANLESPALTGTPTAPTAAAGTNTTQIATTAFTIANRGDRYLTTSTSSNSISTGSKTFTVQSGLSYTATQDITIVYDGDPTNKHMHGQVTSYSGTALVVNVVSVQGSGGPYTSWTINVGGLSESAGALLQANNLSDVANTSAALTNIGGVPTSRTITAGTGLTGGGDLTANRTMSVSFGSSAGTVAAGDDSRITGAAQKSANLSDLASASTARTNLGLGTAATAATGDFIASPTQASSIVLTSNRTLTAGRNVLQSLENYNSTSYVVTLPTSNNAVGDTLVITGGTLTASQIIQKENTAGSPTQTLATLQEGQKYTFRNDTGLKSGWTLVSVDTHTHTASAISDSTTAGRALLTAADAAAQRTSLGLGTLATQSGTFSGTSSGTNTGDQTISLTGDVTGSGTESFAATIANNAVTNAKLAQVATSTIKGRATAATGNVEDLTATQVRTIINVADGATANSSDATLLNRANHTGTQAASTITGLAASATTDTTNAANISSGVLNNSRVNFAAPSAIGSTTAAAITGTTGTFSTLNANNGTLTASAPVLDLSQTWNNAAVTFTGLRLNITDTASAAASNLLEIQVGGVTRMMLKKSGTLHLGQFTNSGFYTPAPAWHGSTAGLLAATNLAIGSSLDTILERGGAGILEQRNLANAQTYRIYNTTDLGLTNYERLFLRWNANVAQIGTEAGGTGGPRTVAILPNNTTAATFGTSDIRLNTTYSVFFTNRSGFSSPADGNIRITNWAENGFGLLQFGGTTSSFPALKRSSITLQVRLADDSGYAPLESSTLALNNGTITSSTPCLTASQTWNNAAENFHLCTIGITNTTPWTASAASSTLFRVQYGGNNAFSVGYTGNVSAAGSIASTSGYTTNGTYQMSSNVNMAAGTSQIWDVWTSSALKLRLWNLGNPSSATNFERANLRWDGNEFIIDVSNGGTGTLRGIKLGSATSSLLGFYGATPVTQRAAIADATDAATTQARLNDLLAAMRSLGLIAT